MSDNVSKKKFVDIVKQYIKYIEEKIKNEINQLDGSDNKKNYGLEALNKVSKSLLNYKEEIESSDFSCTSQETSGTKMITLMTCNSVKQTRIIVQASEIL